MCTSVTVCKSSLTVVRMLLDIIFPDKGTDFMGTVEEKLDSAINPKTSHSILLQS
jgi:hypothetical protein